MTDTAPPTPPTGEPTAWLNINSAAGTQLETLQRRTRRLADLQSDLTQISLSESGDMELLHTSLVRGMCRMLECEAGSLALLNEPDDGWLLIKTLPVLGGEWHFQIVPAAGPGLTRLCLQSRQPLRVTQPAQEPRLDPASDGWGEHNLREMLYMPLALNGHAIGVLKAINPHQGSFDPIDSDLLAILAGQAAHTIHSLRMLQQLKVANADLEANRWEMLSSRSTLRALFDHLPASLYIIDPDYRLVAVNRARALRAERPAPGMLGQPCYSALFGRTSACPDCQVLETLRQAGSTQRTDRRYDRNDDSSDWDISTHPILNDDGHVTQAILLEQEVTERRRLESLITQSEKLAAIGQLAAGVAHEINNPLTAIIANAQILHRELPANSDLQESVDLIARAGARAAQVVRNLLDFARKEDYHLGATDVNETLQRALELVQHEVLARGIRLHFSPDPSLPLILASQDHLQSVWLNLLLNAIDALEQGPGEIKLAARRVGDEIHVTIADNGKGIPPDRLARIFEPFYTTKAAGRGTGLGLSVTHRIIQQHGGRIGVESRPNSGSVFTVILPAS